MSSQQIIRDKMNHKIAGYLVKGGVLDDWRSGSFEKIHSGIKENSNNRLYEHYFTSTQRWRDSYPFISALYSLVRTYRVPIWFLRRSYRYIARQCVWEKSRGWGNYDYPTERLEKANWGKLKYAGGSGAGILTECSLPKEVEMVGYEEKVIDGEVYTRRVWNKEPIIEIQVTRIMGIVPAEVANYYRNVQSRYYRTYGVECKMCNKNVKHNKSDIICEDLYIYIDHICPKCLKKFCKLTKATQELRFIKMQAA